MSPISGLGHHGFAISFASAEIPDVIYFTARTINRVPGHPLRIDRWSIRSAAPLNHLGRKASARPTRKVNALTRPENPGEPHDLARRIGAVIRRIILVPTLIRVRAEHAVEVEVLDPEPIRPEREPRKQVAGVDRQAPVYSTFDQDVVQLVPERLGMLQVLQDHDGVSDIYRSGRQGNLLEWAAMALAEIVAQGHRGVGLDADEPPGRLGERTLQRHVAVEPVATADVEDAGSGP